MVDYDSYRVILKKSVISSKNCCKFIEFKRIKVHTCRQYIMIH